jgi:hypothetical protein
VEPGTTEKNGINIKNKSNEKNLTCPDDYSVLIYCILSNRKFQGGGFSKKDRLADNTL